MRDPSSFVFVFVEARDFLVYFIQADPFYLGRSTRNDRVWISYTIHVLLYEILTYPYILMRNRVWSLFSGSKV